MPPKNDTKTVQKVQCLGVTRNRFRCSRLVSAEIKYCFQHKTQSASESIEINTDTLSDSDATSNHLGGNHQNKSMPAIIKRFNMNWVYSFDSKVNPPWIPINEAKAGYLL